VRVEGESGPIFYLDYAIVPVYEYDNVGLRLSLNLKRIPAGKLQIRTKVSADVRIYDLRASASYEISSAAIDQQSLSGDQSRIVAGEEKNNFGDVFRLTDET